jgi:hypothetical protein
MESAQLLMVIRAMKIVIIPATIDMRDKKAAK